MTHYAITALNGEIIGFNLDKNLQPVTLYVLFVVAEIN
jgi:hypothetical protein